MVNGFIVNGFIVNGQSGIVKALNSLLESKNFV
ncbi:MAG: hypothetical protein JWP81_701 [Ferruginibacter sp.]|nr:hypothetical protein [Ferruginibacter sp.]